jgi:hypothetical protein
LGESGKSLFQEEVLFSPNPVVRKANLTLSPNLQILMDSKIDDYGKKVQA